MGTQRLWLLLWCMFAGAGVGSAQDVASVAATVSCADARAEDISRMARQLLSVLREYPRRGGIETATTGGAAIGPTDIPGAVFRSRTVIRGATDWELANLPTSICETDHPLALAGEVCSICLGGFALQDRLKCMPCTHPFHTDCLNSWLRVKACCPLCKTPLPGTLVTVQLPAIGHAVMPGSAQALHAENHLAQATQTGTGPPPPVNPIPAQPVDLNNAQPVGTGLQLAEDNSAAPPVGYSTGPPSGYSALQAVSALVLLPQGSNSPQQAIMAQAEEESLHVVAGEGALYTVPGVAAPRSVGSTTQQVILQTPPAAISVGSTGRDIVLHASTPSGDSHVGVGHAVWPHGHHRHGSYRSAVGDDCLEEGVDDAEQQQQALGSGHEVDSSQGTPTSSHSSSSSTYHSCG